MSCADTVWCKYPSLDTVWCNTDNIKALKRSFKALMYYSTQLWRKCRLCVLAAKMSMIACKIAVLMI